MMRFIYKAYYKLIRKMGIAKTAKIKNGPLKGYLWKTSVPDNRYILGDYESAMTKIIQNTLKNGVRFVDIGANAGYFSLLGHQLCEENRKPISVEPNPENIQLLKAHFHLNKILKYNIEAVAISNQNGTIQFSDSGNLAANTYKQESSIYCKNTIEVKTITLNALMAKYQLDSNTLIKIDVEGAELDVLMGGEDFIKNFHPAILLATHNCHVPNVEENCLAYLQKMGYKLNPIADHKIPGQADYFCYYLN